MRKMHIACRFDGKFGPRVTNRFISGSYDVYPECMRGYRLATPPKITKSLCYRVLLLIFVKLINSQ